MRRNEVRFMIWLPRELRDAMHKRAQALGMTASAYLRWLVIRDLGWDKKTVKRGEMR